MRNDGQKPQGGVPRPGRTNGFIPTSFRAFSNYVRIVSSRASTVASSVRSATSAASAIVDRENDGNHEQVLWAGFDKLECEEGTTRQVLLLGYQSGFQVWDVEEADNVRNLVSRHDGPVSFMQMLPTPISSKKSGDKFTDGRPLLAICADGLAEVRDALATPCNGSTLNCPDPVNGGLMPTVVRFYSLKTQSYVHVLKFRSCVYSVRCSTRIVVVSQAAQIHCFDAATLEREYTILTNPIATGFSGVGGVGYGPLAVGARWLAYSGSPVVSNSGRVNPQHLTPSASFPSSASNGNLVAHYAKESSKQLAAGILTLGDMGYKKLSRYCSELVPDGNNFAQSGSPGWKVNATVNGHLPDAENEGMVIVRDIVSKSVLTQFRAHRSPISSLCFDPSGTLLVTASVQGHNINVFRIMPGLVGSSPGSDSGACYAHLYRLQRGFTNAVIQDICFSHDSNWILITSSRGTNHLFAISPSGGSVNFQSSDACYTSANCESSIIPRTAVGWPPNSGPQMLSQQSLCPSGPPVTLSVVSRIRSGNSGWRSTVTGAAAAATGRMTSYSGAVASTFHNSKDNAMPGGTNSLKSKYQLLVFSPGCLIQYALRASSGLDSAKVVLGPVSSYDSAPGSDSRLLVEAIQKWNIPQKQSRGEREDNNDIYGENGNSDSSKVYPEGVKRANGDYSEVTGSVATQGEGVKISAEDKHKIFISEAELHMHQARVPLWAKPEISFQSMTIDDIKIDREDASGGEIEIERITARVIEVRPKNLVPVFDYLQTPKFPPPRMPVADSNTAGRLLHHAPGPRENGRLSSRGSSSSLDSMTDGGVGITELQTGIEESRWESSPEAVEGFVNSNDNPESDSQLEIVNNRKGSMEEAQVRFVNSKIEDLKLENQFKVEGDEDLD